MSRAEKPKAIPHDSELAAQEQRRRDELAGNGEYQRGRAQAKAQAIANDRSTLQAEIANLKRATPTRDANTPGRDKYNRTYNRVVKAAERLALATGQPVSGVPAWLAPPEPTAENSVTIAVPKPAPTPIVKPAGMGKSGKGGPAPGFPGSDAHDAWLNVQGAR